MHPNRKFHIKAVEEMAELVRQAGFGVLVAQTASGLRAVHVPFVLREERLLFHVARGNAVHEALAGGCEALMVVNGPHAYVSPDWYGLEGRVPTWSYIAVELNGRVEPTDTDALVGLLDDMSAENESRLAPKPAWTRERISTVHFEALLKAITGFEMRITEWRGTAKVDQDKGPDVRGRIGEALATQGEAELAEIYSRAYPTAGGAGS